MNIQLNTDANISGNERLEKYINTTITEELDRFSDHITRIEVHLSDENGSKKGHDYRRCLIEARLEKMQPIAVTSNANTLEKAVNNSLKKLKKSMSTIYGRLADH